MSYGGDDDETLKLKVVYEAQGVVKEAIADIRRLKEETGQLTKEQEQTLKTLEYQKTLLEGAGSGLDHYTELVHEEATAQKLMRQMLEETNKEMQQQATLVNTELSPALETGAKKTMNLGQAGLQAGYALQDLTQGGIGGILNNIGGLSMALGGGAGLAGLFTAVGVAAFVAKPYIESFFGAMDKEKAKETADALEKQVAAAKQLEDLKTTEAEKANQQFRKYAQTLPEGGKDITRGVRNVFMREADQYLDANERFLQEQYGYDPAKLQEVRAQAQKEAYANAEKRAAEVSGGFLTDPAQRARLHRMATGAPELFPAGLPETISRLEWGGTFQTPDELGKQKLHDEAAERRAMQEIEQGKQKETNRIKKEIQERQAIARKAQQDKDKENRETERLVEQMEAYGVQVENQDIRDAEKKTREAARDARQKTQQDARDARARTPQARRRAAEAAEHEQVAGAVEGANAQFGFARTQGQLDAVTRQAVANVNTGADLATAVQMAVFQTQQKIQREFMAGMNRMHSGGEMRGQ
jgi:hypothetical protein